MSYNFAFYASAYRCVGGAQPGTLALDQFLDETFPKTFPINIYSCRDIFGGNGYSHHAEGRADDRGVPTLSNGAAITAIGNPVIKLLGPHGERLGIDHMIYNRRIWARAYPGGKYYTGAHPHRDHWHIGLTRAAADDLTVNRIRSIVLGTSDPQPVPDPEPPTGDVMLPFTKGQRSEDVRLLKDRMNEAFAGTVNAAGQPYKLLDIAHKDHGDLYEDATENRVRDFLGASFSGHPDAAKGTWVGGNQWNSLELLWIKRKLNL